MVDKIATQIKRAFKKGNTVFIAGNGGSAEMSNHFAAELVCKFKHERKALPAISLTSNNAIITAIANDYSFDKVFTRQLEAYSKAGDIYIALTTSGQSRNILESITWAKDNGLKVFMLPTNKETGTNTADTQLLHLEMIHEICEIVEEAYI